MRKFLCFVAVSLVAGCAVSPEQFAQTRQSMPDVDICLALKTAEKANDQAFIEMTRQEAASRGFDSERCTRMIGERGEKSAQLSATVLGATQRLQQATGQLLSSGTATLRPPPASNGSPTPITPAAAAAGHERRDKPAGAATVVQESSMGTEPALAQPFTPPPFSPPTTPNTVHMASPPSTSPEPPPQIGNKRIALVIGNAFYRSRPLKNPVNDADDMSRALRASGFQVINVRNASLSQMRQAVRQFGERLQESDVGLVYYSGHGLEVKGRNYFIPVNADIRREDEVADQSLDVSLVLEKMETAKKSVNILIIDACRDDPFGRGFRTMSRGLAAMEAPTGTIIAYSTSPGRVAADGEGRNSPYTKHLLTAMQAPGKPIEQVFKEVRRAVQKETKAAQVPWENTSLSGDFFFRTPK